MKNIVVASDLSQRSRPAIKRALALAADSGARLTVTHVVDDTMPTALSEQMVAGAAALLNEQVAQHMGARDIRTDIRVISGDVFEEMNRLAEAVRADLLVLGLHRRRKFFDRIRETTMEHLVRASRVPVLLAVDEGRDAYVDVLCGIDLSRVCAQALHKIRVIAPQAQLTLFHAHEISFRQEAGRDYDTWQAMHVLPGNLPPPVFVEANVTDALHKMMDEKTYDLLAIGAHTRSNSGRYVLGGFSSGLIRKPPCDLLLAK